MGLQQIFVGVPQSKYAALAILVAILAVSISVLFGKESMPLSQKIGAILLLILVTLPGILYSLFQLTCLVTGAGVNNKRWWCAVYAWLISALLIVYSVLLIAIAILSIFSGKNIAHKSKQHNIENFDANMAMANKVAGTVPPTAVSGTSVGGVYPSVPAVVNNAVTTGMPSNGAATNSVANPTLLNNANVVAQTTNVDVGTKQVGTHEQDRNGGPFLAAENPADYPFPSSPYGHGWEPLNSIDLPLGA
jgi:hypothetical protein